MSDGGAFRPLSVAELFALELPAVDWAVEEILPLGSAGLLSAREKAGKGLVAIDLCASVALGEPFLDRAVREGPAIYCAAEEHVRDVRERVAARVGERRDAPLYVLPLDGSTVDHLKLDDPEEMQRLWDMVIALEPVIVILDTLREMHDRKEDSSDEMGPVLRPLRQLAHQTETTVLVNHHQNRGGSFRGSTAIRAAFDLEWAFTRTEEGDEEGPPRGLLRVEGRHGPRRTLPIRLGEGMRWEVATVLPVVPDPTIRERILGYLVQVGGWRTAGQIAEGLGTKQKTVQNQLAAMVREGPRPLAVDGAGTKSDPRRYHALAPALWELEGGEGEGKMIPPAMVPLRETVGGNHFAGSMAEDGVAPEDGSRGDGGGGNHFAGDAAAEMIPPEMVPLRGMDGGNHFGGRREMVPEASGTQGNHPGTIGGGWTGAARAGWRTELEPSGEAASSRWTR